MVNIKYKKILEKSVKESEWRKTRKAQGFEHVFQLVRRASSFKLDGF